MLLLELDWTLERAALVSSVVWLTLRHSWNAACPCASRPFALLLPCPLQCFGMSAVATTTAVRRRLHTPIDRTVHWLPPYLTSSPESISASFCRSFGLRRRRCVSCCSFRYRIGLLLMLPGASLSTSSCSTVTSHFTGFWSGPVNFATNVVCSRVLVGFGGR